MFRAAQSSPDFIFLQFNLVLNQLNLAFFEKFVFREDLSLGIIPSWFHRKGL